MQKLSAFLTNPVLVKEFRSRMRTWKTLSIIIGYLAVIGGITLAFIFMEGGNRMFANPGQSRDIFIMLSMLQMGLIGFVAPGLSAGVISGERERQTLNILLTTQLSPLKIILSKFISSIVFIALLVFSTLPIYAIVVLYGGVGPREVLAVFGYYLLTILLCGAVGIFCSSWFKRTGVSTVVAYGFTAFLLVGTGLIAILVYTALQYYYRQAIVPMEFPEIFYLIALNPVANLMGTFYPDVLSLGMDPMTASAIYPMTPWVYCLMVNVSLILLLLTLSVRNLSPVKRPLFRRKSRRLHEQSQAMTHK